MKKIYLLKTYQTYGANEIITVSNNVASGLIDNGTARLFTNRDFLVKPDVGESKAIDILKLKRSIKIQKK